MKSRSESVSRALPDLDESRLKVSGSGTVKREIASPASRIRQWARASIALNETCRYLRYRSSAALRVLAGGSFLGARGSASDDQQMTCDRRVRQRPTSCCRQELTSRHP